MKFFQKKSIWTFLRAIIFIVVISALLAGFSLGLNFYVYRQIQTQFGVEISGGYKPSLFIPSFKIQNGSFVWENRVRLLKGDFSITFDPLTVLYKKGMRVVFECDEVKIELLGSWAAEQGIGKTDIQYAFADVIVNNGGISEVNALKIFSPSFQFSIKNSDKD